MSEQERSTWAQVGSTLIGGLCVLYVGIDLWQAGGIEAWSKWRVAGYGLLLFAGLYFCHPHSGRWLAEQVLGRFGGDG